MQLVEGRPQLWDVMGLAVAHPSTQLMRAQELALGRASTVGGLVRREVRKR